ncbi:MAG: hypothetical protein R2828_23745 [Saprospiraceae bacterium]
MKDDYFKKIEQYFQQELSEKELAEFQQQLAEDEAFASAFETRQQMETFLENRPKREQLKATLTDMGEAFFQETNTDTPSKPAGKRIPMRSRLYWLASAAAAVLLLIFAWPFLFPSTPTYSQFAEHRPLSLQEKSVDGNALAGIEAAFNNKDYRTAHDGLNNYLKNNPHDITAFLYKGICALELNQLEEAQLTFENIRQKNSVLGQTAQWYLALTYLKRADFDNCKATLATIPADNYWYPKAQKLLARLP